MKQKNGPKTGGRKKGIIILIIVVLLLVIIGVALYFGFFQQKSQGTGQDWQQQQGEFDLSSVQGDMVAAYGVTSIGMIEETFPITNLENALEIEEVYITSGDSITENTALFKITQESLEAVKTELEEDLRAADLAYRAGVIEYEQSKITAYYEKESTLLSSNQAAAIYEETTSGLYENVQKAKEELEEVQAEIAEYEAAISGNSYYEDYQVEYYKNLYEENRALLTKRVEEWGVSWSEITGGGMGGNSMSRSVETGTVSGGDAGQNLHSQYVTVLSSFYKVLEQNLSDYENAQEQYEDAVENAEFELQTLKLQLSTLEQKYAEAMESYESNILQAQLTKETAVSNGEKAESIYEADMEKAETDLQDLQDAREEAEENLALFELHIKDGCYYGSEAGSLLRVNIREGGNINSESRLYTMSDTDEISVTVSVGQSDIAKLSVGDTAMVQSTESGVYNGVITAINPISSSDSKSSVTYSVTVALNKGAESLGSNETVIVYFGMGNGAQENEN